jgi:putative peptidoglycan lipid II flippase
MRSGGLVRAAGVVGFATLLSRILGYVRDMVIAYFFGTGDAADAFFVAFRIPNLLRRLFAEGSLTVAFIPIFTEYLVRESKKTGDASKFELTVILTRIMFPYIFFISLVALCMGILNSLKHFAAPALAPVLLNLSMILSVIILMPYFSQPVLALALGVIIGGFTQLALQIPFLKKKEVTLKVSFNFSHPGLKRLVKLMLPAVLGAAVYQINIVIITMIASFLPAGSVSYLYYSDRVFQFPLALFGIALATASLPAMSDQVAQNKMDDLKETLSHSLRLIFFITIPAMVGLAVLGIPIVRILFQRGEFSAEATLLTAKSLLWFTVGLWSVAGVRVVANVFYALQDIWTPVKVAVVSIIGNLVLCLVLMKPLQHGGLALAVSLSSMLNLMILLVMLRMRLGRLGIRKVVFSSFKALVCSAVMGMAVYFTYHSEFWTTHQFPANGVVVLAASIVSGVFVFFFCSYLLKSDELSSLWEGVKRGNNP